MASDVMWQQGSGDLDMWKYFQVTENLLHFALNVELIWDKEIILDISGHVI